MSKPGARLVGWLAAAAALLGAPLVLPADWVGVLVSAVVFVAAALGLHIVVGRCRLLDLGYAGFIGLGAYTTAVLMKTAGWGYGSAALLAGLCALLAGIALGLPTLHLRGDYFAIVTFGFSELVVLFIRNWPRVTGGALGLGDIPNPALLGHEIGRYPPTGYWYLALGLLTAVIAFSAFFSRTSLGTQMVAAGDDPILALSMGIDVTAVKVCAFALSAAIGGLVGSFWAVYYKFLSYPEFSLNLSVQVLAIVILAGTRRVRDVVVAGAVLGLLGEATRRGLRLVAIPESARFIVYGVALVLIVLARARVNRYDQR
jgi:branched-chain amino acid transport system permease protein